MSAHPDPGSEARKSTGRLDAAVRERDFFRRSPFSVGGLGGHKEWHHFCILAPDLDLLVNFSLSDDTGPETAEGAELARLTVLVHGGHWEGDVDTFAPDDVWVGGGRIDVRFGNNRLSYEDGRYRLCFALAERAVSGEVVLEPKTMPSLAPNIPLPEGPPLHWVLIPRCLASGEVAVAGRTHRFERALAYHDHNWGHFLWGHAFSWIWGFCLPARAAEPWSVAFVRLSNRLRTSALAQGLFVWRGERHARVFRDHDLELTMSREFLAPSRVFKVPRVMALLSPEERPDVPRWVAMEAREGDDWLRVRFEAHELAQVIIPSETDLSVTIINEVTGRALMEGRVGGERVEVDGRGVCEFLSA